MIDSYASEVEALTARKNGRRRLLYLLRFGRRKNKITLGGGSSSILSSAFHASRVSICASSTMYTLKRPSADGAYIARSRRLRASSTPRFEAASISTTSRAVWPPQIRVQLSQMPHGSPSSLRSAQFKAIARTRASVVLPTPRGPQNKYAWPTCPLDTARRSVSETCSCVTTSANDFGRYFLAKALYDNSLYLLWVRLHQSYPGFCQSLRGNANAPGDP